MADREESHNILIQSLKENAKNKNTQQSTSKWIKLCKSWASDNRYEEYEPKALNKILSLYIFFTYVVNQ